MRFRGTPYETDTCPRRHLLENPELVDVFRLVRTVGDRPGIESIEVLTSRAFDALTVVDSSKAWRAEELAKERERKQSTG